MFSHIPLKERSQIRKLMLQKGRITNERTFFLTALKTEISTYAQEPKLRGFRAEDAMRDLFHEQSDLMTVDHKVLNGGSESRNNHRYAVGHQSCSIRFETIPFFGNGNVKSDGSSIVKSIEADGPIVSDHHIHILPFHVFLASH